MKKFLFFVLFSVIGLTLFILVIKNTGWQGAVTAFKLALLRLFFFLKSGFEVAGIVAAKKIKKLIHLRKKCLI